MLVFERRLVAILSADIAGYCRLIGLDDEETLARLLRYRKVLERIVASHGGRMFGVAGDSWMGEFESATAAVRCAIACQREIEDHNQEVAADNRIRFRIGLNLGGVLAKDGDLYGEEVNIAARLQERCRPGDLVISDSVFFKANGELTGFKTVPLGALQLKNISGPITAYACEITAGRNETDPERLVPAIDLSQPVPGFMDKRAIAVLPFHVANAKPGMEHIGEGFADDLVTGLSNLRWFPVMSRSSSFIFKNQSLDTQSVGRALGVCYLVTGSVRKTGSNLRLNVNLEDAQNGANLWAQRFDIDFEKLFEVQDEIVDSIVSVLDSEIDRAEQSRSRARSFEELDAWGLIRRGVWHLRKLTKQDAAQARQLIEDALRRDPSSAEARIQLGWCQFWEVWSARRDLSLMAEVERLGREAAAIEPRDARAHHLVGIGLLMMRKTELARPHLLKAIHLNPSLAMAHSCLGSNFILSGEPERAIKPLLLSIRLNPYDPYGFHFLGELAIAFHMQGHWGKACEFAERSLQIRPNYWYAKAIRIASLARSGRIEKAQELASEPGLSFSLDQINWLPFVEKKWNNFLREGLELAGCTITGCGD